jgi:hypothetical protein
VSDRSHGAIGDKEEPMTTSITLRRLVQGIATASAVLALLAPTALAGSGQHDPWYGYGLSLTAQQAPVAPFITDTLAPGGGSQHDPWYAYAVSLTAQPQQTPVAPFVTDTLAPGGGSSAVSPSTGNGFDWADFGIGAGAAIAAILLMGGATLALGRRRGSRLAF